MCFRNVIASVMTFDDFAYHLFLGSVSIQQLDNFNGSRIKFYKAPLGQDEDQSAVIKSFKNGIC